ncbi:MAG: pilin [Clostridia bacterium]|nr:pilin [Clostridia bacterium]
MQNSSSKSKNTSTQKGATSKTDITGAISSADDFIDDGKKEGTVINLEKFKGTNDAIYNSLLSIGVGIAVVVSGILGIQFMIGGAEEKANVKEKLTPFIIGCVVIFGAFGIWKIVTIILKNIAS